MSLMLQCNSVVDDQTNMDNDTVSKGEYVIMYAPSTPLK